MLRLFFVSVNSGMGHGDISPGKAYILSLVYNLALEKRGSICYNYGVAVCPFSQTRKGDNQWERISKGKTAVRGICQRKDGLYYARFVDKAGKRHDKYFQTLPEARNWIEEAEYADKHEDFFAATETTVDEWFNFWIENSLLKTVLMIPTFINSATKQGYPAFVCMRCGTPTPRGRLKVGCSPRCCKNCWDTPVSKQRWIGIFM